MAEVLHVVFTPPRLGAEANITFDDGSQKTVEILDEGEDIFIRFEGDTEWEIVLQGVSNRSPGDKLTSLTVVFLQARFNSRLGKLPSES